MRIDIHAEEVEELLTEFLAARDPGKDLLREASIRHRGLPLLGDMSGCILLTRIGELVWVHWDHPDAAPIPVSDPRMVNSALHLGSLRYPKLSKFAPVRPADGVTCPFCNGTGKLSGPAGKIPNVQCYCGGLGWIPKGTEP
jgi:hypothetical protein